MQKINVTTTAKSPVQPRPNCKSHYLNPKLKPYTGPQRYHRFIIPKLYRDSICFNIVSL